MTLSRFVDQHVDKINSEPKHRATDINMSIFFIPWSPYEEPSAG
jgi:hypothetical protein